MQKYTIMKTIIIILAAVLSLSMANVYAGNPKTVVYSNEDVTDKGVVKEFISYNTEVSRPLKKSVYQYSPDGILFKKTVYNWNSEAGWIGMQKYDYECDNKGHMVNLIYTEWDSKLNTWSCQSEQLVHVYDYDGELLATKQIHINNDVSHVLSQK
ncbi:DUF3836 domain-containing protein [Prevotella sp. 10(H)]|uniref:DUF3836 domain-containing protein n=1 Tax=Prevotella sp. 10(H) TaxID=1158294 RepID=UPI0009DE7AD5|nr:DUF3836 domain-containing protein [Prevotella sp. 10(H)]